MAIYQSDWATMVETTPVPDCAGDLAVALLSYTVPTGVTITSADIIEMGFLPAYCVPVDATLFVDELGAATYDVGIMSGEVGDTTPTRTSGNELFAAAADATFNRLSKVQALRLAPTDKSRSIGIKPSANLNVGAGQVITLAVYYAANP